MSGENPEPEILTVAEVAAYFRVKRDTIYRLLKARQLPAFQVGGDWRFRAKDLRQWQETRAKMPTTPLAVPPKPHERKASS